MGAKANPPIEKTCPTCKVRFTVAFKFRRQKFCGHRCAIAVNAGVRAASRRPDVIAKRADKRRGSGKGLWYIKRDGRHEHRAVAEKKIGRPLGRHEVAHHGNENKRDNAADNIEVMTRAEHSRFHQLGKKKKPRMVCKRGHPLDEGNVVITSIGRRRCKICDEAWWAAYRASHRKDGAK